MTESSSPISSDHGQRAAPSLPAYWVDVHPEHHCPAPERAWHKQLHALAGAMFAEEETAPPQARLNWCVYQIDDVLTKSGGRGVLAYRFSLWVLSWVAPLLIFRLPRFARLSHEDRVRALKRFDQSVFRTLLFALKALLCIVYFEHPDAAAEVQFDGVALLEARDDA